MWTYCTDPKCPRYQPGNGASYRTFCDKCREKGRDVKMVEGDNTYVHPLDDLTKTMTGGGSMYGVFSRYYWYCRDPKCNSGRPGGGNDQAKMTPGCRWCRKPDCFQGDDTPNVPPLPVKAPAAATILTADSEARKAIPLCRGLLDYFPAALAEVARLSKVGNDKHNPGEPMHHARAKSNDHADCIMRHLIERGDTDTDGLSHSVKVAWRALALLQEELEAKGAPKARGAK